MIHNWKDVTQKAKMQVHPLMRWRSIREDPLQHAGPINAPRSSHRYCVLFRHGKSLMGQTLGSLGHPLRHTDLAKGMLMTLNKSSGLR
jgi:hypothetical protein